MPQRCGEKNRMSPPPATPRRPKRMGQGRVQGTAKRVARHQHRPPLQRTIRGSDDELLQTPAHALQTGAEANIIRLALGGVFVPKMETPAGRKVHEQLRVALLRLATLQQPDTAPSRAQACCKQLKVGRTGKGDVDGWPACTRSLHSASPSIHGSCSSVASVTTSVRQHVPRNAIFKHLRTSRTPNPHHTQACPVISQALGHHHRLAADVGSGASGLGQSIKQAKKKAKGAKSTC